MFCPVDIVTEWNLKKTNAQMINAQAVVDIVTEWNLKEEYLEN